jgi:hypothetical protein
MGHVNPLTDDPVSTRSLAKGKGKLCLIIGHARHTSSGKAREK